MSLSWLEMLEEHINQAIEEFEVDPEEGWTAVAAMARNNARALREGEK